MSSFSATVFSPSTAALFKAVARGVYSLIVNGPVPIISAGSVSMSQTVSTVDFLLWVDWADDVSDGVSE